MSSSQAQRYAKHCNEVYAARLRDSGALAKGQGPEPTAKVAIITCMDARLDLFQMFGLNVAEAHLIRVGGGRTPDALRSLVASEQVLGTQEVMVVHHTDCGFSHAPSRDELYKKINGGLGGPVKVDHIPFMPILEGPEASVRDDVEYLKQSALVKSDAVISGWVYDTFEGTIKQVV